MVVGRCLSRYFSALSGGESFGFFSATLRRLSINSPRFGIGISSPFGVFCVFLLPMIEV